MVSGTNRHPLSPLEALPNDVLTEILWRVGAHSRDDLKNCVLTCREFLDSVDDPKVFKTLDIPDLVSNPLLVGTLFKTTFTKCLAHSNPSALYIQGILEYFVRANPLSGLSCLKKAADACVQDAVYLYGIIMLARGDFGEGSRYMERLNWRANMEEADNCWISIKKSLSGIDIPRQLIYYRSALDMKPPPTCNLYDNSRACPKCYYYKQLVKFIYKF